VIEACQFLDIEGHAIVLVVAAELGRSQVPQFIQFLLMAALFYPVSERFDALSKFLWRCFDLKQGLLASLVFAPVETKAYERELSFWGMIVEFKNP
jgi:hypothetical protein